MYTGEPNTTASASFIRATRPATSSSLTQMPLMAQASHAVQGTTRRSARSTISVSAPASAAPASTKDASFRVLLCIVRGLPWMARIFITVRMGREKI